VRERVRMRIRKKKKKFVRPADELVIVGTNDDRTMRITCLTRNDNDET
jgi:hypothetical protein